MRFPRMQLGLLLGATVVAAVAAGAGAATASCVVEDTSTEEVLPGVVLTWDSSFLCADAPTTGDFSITVRVASSAASSEAAMLDELGIRGTTPRPRGIAPDATADASGLPLSVAPGATASFDVSGTYELVTTDEGDKSNLHLQALGIGAVTGELFELGINVHFRGIGSAEDGGDDDGGQEGGRPSWAGTGPPPWVVLPRGGPPSSSG